MDTDTALALEMLEDVKSTPPEVIAVSIPEDTEIITFNYRAYVRLLTPIVGLVGAILTDVYGKELTTSVDEMTSYISYTLIALGVVHSWWKNNDVTKKAKKRTAIINQVENQISIK